MNAYGQAAQPQCSRPGRMLAVRSSMAGVADTLCPDRMHQTFLLGLFATLHATTPQQSCTQPSVTTRSLAPARTPLCGVLDAWHVTARTKEVSYDAHDLVCDALGASGACGNAVVPHHRAGLEVQEKLFPGYLATMVHNRRCIDPDRTCRWSSGVRTSSTAVRHRKLCVRECTHRRPRWAANA